MAIAEVMKSLSDAILASYDARVRAVADVVRDTRKTIKNFASDRKRMSTEQAEALSNYVKDLNKAVNDLIKGFAKNHRQMSEEQAKNLVEFVKNITKEVSSKLKDFQKQRQETSEKLKDKLNKEIKEIQGWVKDTVSGAQALIAEYHSDMVKAKRTWQGMASTLALAKEKGVMPKIEAGEKITTVEKEVKRRGRKRRKRKKR